METRHFTLPITAKPIHPSVGRLAAIVAGGNVIAIVLQMVSGLITARLLAPEVLGTFAGIGLILTYAPLLQVGVINGLNRELPFFIGRGDTDRVQRLASSALGWAILCGAIAGMASVIYACVSLVQGEVRLAVGWAAHAVALLLWFPNAYLQSTYRTSADFAKLTMATTCGSILSIVLLGLVAWLGFDGLCLRMVLIIVASNLLLWVWRPVRVTPALERRELAHLVRIGLPIFGVGYAYSAWTRLDAVLVLAFFGSAALGHYQIATLVLAAGAVGSQALNQVLYPRMAQRYGETGDARSVLALAWRPVLLLAALMLPAIVAGWILLPHVVRWLLPNYAPGISAGQWMLVAVWFMSFTPLNQIYNVIKRQDVYLCVIAAAAGTFLTCLPWRLAASVDPLAAVAQSMAAGMGVFALAGAVSAVACASKHLREDHEA